ncbi:TNT domain-containing protein [Mycolicibacterium neoaurum]|uniref:TNT domain-containing protein n=1 Tax=Mycolicibacterium neoaurum TaxID=1795 RepID=UPI00141DF143|nr:TNT domain-containing protein [Mycolicibacterium neoaurum]
MLEATGMNYQHADQASVPGGSGPTGSVSGEQAETKAGDAPYASVTGMVPPPPKWWLIQPLLNMVPLFGMALTWPTGNSAMMNLTAAQWSNIGRGLKVFEPALQSAEILAGAQDIPEAGQIKKALQDLGDGATKLASIADQLSTTITDFARTVQETQDAIRRLLDRISLDGLWDTVTGFFTGEGENTLRQIAKDVGTVLENFQNQLQGVLGLLQELGNLLGEAADSFQKWIRPILVGAFGEDVGNLMADGLKIYTGLQVGVGVAAIGLVSGTLALADPDTWKGMADTAIMIAKDPSKLDDVVKESLGQFLAVDKITGENPERGIGEAAGNIASLFLPGGIFAKGGAVAKGLSATRRLFEKGELGPLERLPGLDGTRRPELPDLPDNPGAPHLPEFTPSPGVPPAVVNPPGGSPGSPNGSPSVRPQTGEPGGPSSTGSGPGAGNAPSPNGSAPHHDGAGPGTPSTGGPAPTGGSPTHGGGAGSGGSASGGPVPAGGSPTHGGSDGSSGAASGGSSSNGPVPTGGSPISGGDAPAGGSHSSPPAESSGSGGPSKSGGGDGPGPVSSGGGSESGGGSHSGGGEGPGSSSESGGGAHNSDDGMSQRPDESHFPSGDSSHDDPTHDPHPGGEDKDPPAPIPATERFPDASPYGDLTKEEFEHQYVDDSGELIYPDENDPSKPYAIPGTIRDLTPDDIKNLDGTILDRVGHPGGKWLAPEGADYGERALPPSSLEKDYYRYRVNADNPLPPGWTIEESRVAPWFGQPGGGLQYRIVAPKGERPNILELLEPPGFLEPI